jgi:hypothetical protein
MTISIFLIQGIQGMTDFEIIVFEFTYNNFQSSNSNFQIQIGIFRLKI